MLYPDLSWDKVLLVDLGNDFSAAFISGGARPRTLLTFLEFMVSLTEFVCMVFRCFLYSCSEIGRSGTSLLISRPNLYFSVFFMILDGSLLSRLIGVGWSDFWVAKRNCFDNILQWS